MFFLLGGNDKKARKVRKDPVTEKVKDLFLSGKFPVVTTDRVEGKEVSKMLGLVCCRGYDSEEAFFGMASRAVSKGAHAIVGYKENVAFHPDGSKYFCCYGTAVMFDWEPEEKYGAAALLSSTQQASAIQDQMRQEFLRAADTLSAADEGISSLRPGTRVGAQPEQNNAEKPQQGTEEPLKKDRRVI